MRALSAARAAPSLRESRTLVPNEFSTEQSFGSVFGDIAKLLWPNKTAYNLSLLIGCSERAAEFYLAGDREWSGDAIAELVAEVLRRHKMRNVKVRAR